MYRSERSSSRVCTQRTRNKNYDRHRERLRNIKPSIDTRPPKRFTHLKRNLKKLQTEQERYEKVNYENQILLNKMTDILDRKHIDNDQDMRYFKSLNAGRRKRRLVKINEENQAILKRILHRQPVYSHLNWKRDRQRNKRYCSNICEYPYTLPGSSQGERGPPPRRTERMERPVYQEEPFDDDEEFEGENHDEENEHDDAEIDAMLAETEAEERAIAEEEEAQRLAELQRAQEEEALKQQKEEEEAAKQEAARLKAEEEEAARLKKEEEEAAVPKRELQKAGELELTIVKVNDIKASDLLSKPDPYVKITMGKLKKKTKTQKSTRDPEFNETFKLNVEDCTSATILVELYEDDFITSDDKLGHFTLSLAELDRDVEVTKVMSFEDAKSEETKITFTLRPTFGFYTE